MKPQARSSTFKQKLYWYYIKTANEGDFILPYIFATLKMCTCVFRGENVEDAFLDTAKKIYQNIQDGR